MATRRSKLSALRVGIAAFSTGLVAATAAACGAEERLTPPASGRSALEQRLQPAATPAIQRAAERLQAEPGELARPYIFRWPLDNIDVTSPFGLRMHPVVKRLLHHGGVDFRAPRGTPVLASGPGVVELAGWKALTGNTVIVTHPGQLATLYAHLDELLVFPGQRVDRGAPVGLLGNTGRSTGAHLHFGLYRLTGEDRHALDPSEFMGQRIDPAHPPVIPLPAPRPRPRPAATMAPSRPTR